MKKSRVSCYQILKMDFCADISFRLFLLCSDAGRDVQTAGKGRRQICFCPKRVLQTQVVLLSDSRIPSRFITKKPPMTASCLLSWEVTVSGPSWDRSFGTVVIRCIVRKDRSIPLWKARWRSAFRLFPVPHSGYARIHTDNRSVPPCLRDSG